MANQGWQFTRDQAIAAAKIQIQKLINNNTLNNADCQVGLLSQDKTTVTYPDGTTGQVSVVGQPGDVVVVCNGIAVVPEPTQVNLSGGLPAAYIVGYNSSDKNDSFFYIRKIGFHDQVRIPSDLGDFKLDERILAADHQAKFSSDGKCLLIGGFYNDVPKDYNPVFNGNDAPFTAYPVPGFTYHTIAQWIIFPNFSIGQDAQGNSIFKYSAGATDTNSNTETAFWGELDLTAEAQGKIPPPASQGLGSSAVYRLFPSNADLYVPTQNTADGSAGFAHARFFPAANQSYTTSTPTFPIYDFFPWTNPPYEVPVFAQTCYVTTSGSMETIWAGDGNALPLFRGVNVPWGCTNSNLEFVFNVQTDSSGQIDDLNYVVDIVADISYATSYNIVQDRIQTYDTHGEDDAGGPFANCDGSTFHQTCYLNSAFLQQYQSDIAYVDVYPFLLPFYNSFIDRYILPGNIYVTGPQGPYGGLGTGIPQLQYGGGGSGSYQTVQVSPGCDGNGPDVAYNGAINWTYFGNLCSSMGEPFPCVYWKFNGIGGLFGLCEGPGLLDSCGCPCFFNPDQANYQITDWDGTSFSIDFYGGLFTGGPFGTGAAINGFFTFLYEGACNPAAGCFGSGFNSVLASALFGFSGGFFDAYRYGRGICAFNAADTIEIVLKGEAFRNENYKGPSIVVSRLQSPLAQNHLFQTFRSTNGKTACTYQIADPYVIPSASNQQVITYQDAIDELNNPLAYDGVNVLDPVVQNNVPVPGGSRGFSAYCFATNYTDQAVFVNQSNFVKPPDVMTDKILSPNKTFPIGYTLIKGVDSYAVQAYDIVDTQNEDGSITSEEFIYQYNISTLGLIKQGPSTTGRFLADDLDFILDYILPLKILGGNPYDT